MTAGESDPTDEHGVIKEHEPGIQLRALIDHLPACVGYWNRELRNEIANAAYLEWFGLAPEQVRGRHMRDVLGETLFAANQQYIAGALGGAAQRFEVELTDANGVSRHSQSVYVPDLADGEVRGIVVLAIDVSARVLAERELAASAERYRALVRSIPGGFVVQFDHDLRFSIADGDALDAFGLTREKMEGRTLAEAMPSELATELEPRYRDALRGRARAWDRILGDRVFRLTSGPVRDAQGRILGGTVVCYDVTAERRSEATSRALHAIAALIAQSAPLEQTLTTVVDQLRQVFLLERAGVARFIDADRFEYVAMSPPVDDPIPTGSVTADTSSAVAEVARTGRAAVMRYDERAGGVIGDFVRRGQLGAAAVPVVVAGELWGTIGLGTSDPRLLDAAMLERLAGFGDLVAVAVANAEAWEALTRRAVTDPLTGVGNRRAFYDALAREVEWARRHERDLSVVLVDIDHFKRINDRHGHQVGDRALTHVARGLAASIRSSEMVGRIGGEEFAWLLPEAGAAEALRAAERARLAIAASEFEDLGSLTVSMGVATLGRGGDAESLVRAADEALYAAKAGGRNVTRLAAITPPPGVGDGVALPARSALGAQDVVDDGLELG